MWRILLFLFLFPAASAAQVNILDFRATPVGDALSISWTIGPGNTCEDLEVQHSTDSVNFTMLYLYAGVCGDATFSQQYNWTHNTPACGVKNYYRLFARTGGQLAVLSTDHSCLGTAGYRIFLAQQPKALTLQLSLQKSPEWKLELTDAQGKILHAQVYAGTEQTIVLPALPSGVIIYRLTTERDDVFTGKLFFR
ncbi:MAG: T9SS type A sorting domain-containing protein [Bacteroidetes bacterium]|nr:T9SS type A sorting domain-containing protein [Bacteroidota bacterium]